MNIFLQLSKWAKRQGENFATDSFAITLSHLIENDPKVGGNVLNFLTGGLFEIDDAITGDIQITTQRNEGKGHGTPDMRIESTNKLALIEVKAGSPLGKDQLLSYRQALESTAHPMTKLVLLTQYLTPLGEHYPDHSLRWYQLAQLLTDARNHNPLSPTSSYLVDQFLEFLRRKNLALHEVRSRISESINKHRLGYGDDAIVFKRIKSLKRIAKHAELKPLHDVLHLMGSVLDHLGIEPKPRFDSGQQTGGWVGYNIESMKYWFCIYYSAPDTLVFETKLWKGERMPLTAPSVGEYFYMWKSTYWRNLHDLGMEDGKFFTLSPEEQFNQVFDFAQTSFDHAVFEHTAA